MKPYLIFDYDGVIADSRESWFYSFKETLKKLGYKKEITPEDLMRVAGPKTEATIERFLGEKENSRGAEGKEIIDKIVSTKGVEKMNLCSNAKETLDKLQKLGYSMCLLTNSDAAFVYPSLKKVGLDSGIWDLVITADDTFPTKENAIGFIAAANGLKTADCVYVADRPHDIEVARSAGAKIICVSNETSWSAEEDLKKLNPDCIIHNLPELPNALKKMQGD